MSNAASTVAPAGAQLRPLRRSLPMALLRAREAVMDRFRRMLRENGLTEQQWRVIRVLAEGDSLEISHLAEKSFLLPPSLSRILKFLVSEGLVRRRATDADQRRVEVSLTAAGRRRFRRIAPYSETIYREIENEIGQERLEQLYELLSELETSLSQTRAGP